jgi:predicted phosphodiesterase
VTDTSTGAPVSAPVGTDPIVPGAATGSGLSNYTIVYVNGTLTINPATLTITADDDSKTYGMLETLGGASFTESGLVTANGDTITGVTETSAGAIVSATVGTDPIVASAAIGTGLSNYTITYVNGTLTVNPATLTITANNDSKTYGTLETSSDTAFTETGLISANGDTITGVTETSAGAAVSAMVGSDPIVPSAATGTGLSNYTIDYVNGALTVNPATLTITANNSSKTYGTFGSLSETAFTETGLVSANGDTVTEVTETSTGAAVSATVGTDPIVPSAARGDGLSNYTINYVNGTLTINPATLTITAGNESKTYGSTLKFAGTEFVESGLVAGDSVTSVTLTSAGAAQSAPAGSFPIVPSALVGSGLSNYTIIFDNATLTVTPAPLTIAAQSASIISGQAIPALSVDYSGFRNGDTPASLATPPAVSTAATSASPAGNYSINVSGASSPNYVITYVSGVLTVSPALATDRNVTIQKVKTGKHKTVEVIVVQFSEAMNSSSVQNPNHYTLATIPANKKQKSKPVPIASATYNSGAFTVTLVTRKPLALNPPLELTILGAGILDDLGRPLAGDDSGMPGSNAVVTLTKAGATVDSAAPLVRAKGLSPTVVDALFDAGFRNEQHTA